MSPFWSLTSLEPQLYPIYMQKIFVCLICLSFGIATFTGCQSTQSDVQTSEGGLPAKDTAPAGQTENLNSEGNFQGKPPIFQTPSTPQSIPY